MQKHAHLLSDGRKPSSIYQVQFRIQHHRINLIIIGMFVNSEFWTPGGGLFMVIASPLSAAFSTYITPKFSKNFHLTPKQDAVIQFATNRQTFIHSAWSSERLTFWTGSTSTRALISRSALLWVPWSMLLRTVCYQDQPICAYFVGCCSLTFVILHTLSIQNMRACNLLYHLVQNRLQAQQCHSPGQCFNDSFEWIWHLFQVSFANLS